MLKISMRKQYNLYSVKLMKHISPIYILKYCFGDDSKPADNLQNCFQSSSEVVETNKNAVNAVGRYKVFKDVDAQTILDVEEERYLATAMNVEVSEPLDYFAGLNKERGKTGVFDIHELVQLLKKDNAKHIFVATVPAYFRYVDYIVLVSGKSERHLTGLAEYVRRAFKYKRHTSDIIPKIEGVGSKDWIALDLGNIALHIMSKQARSCYDLETLWSVGAQYDTKLNEPEDPVIALLQKHSISLDDFKPANSCN